MKISWQAGEWGLITIYVDGESWRQGHRSILGTKPNIPPECSDLRELQSSYEAVEYAGAKKYALQRLSVRGYSIFELKELLKAKHVSQETTERLCEALQKLGYLNDEEWTNAFVRNQLAKKKGPNHIKAKLRQKGVSAVLQEDVLESQKNAIETLLKTRYRTRNLADFHERQKVIASLVRRGFDLEHIAIQINLFLQGYTGSPPATG